MSSDRATTLFNQLDGIITNLMALTSLRLGHDLGIFAAMEESGPLSSGDLASKLKLSKRYILEWSIHLASMGYIDYHADTDTFSLPKEHAELLCAQEGGLLPMLCHLSENHTPHYPLLKLAFQADQGIFWGDMPSMAAAARAFFKPVYEGLLPHWIRGSSGALGDTMSQDGIKIADIGCGCGVSTVNMASMCPQATILGVDYHHESVTQAHAALSEQNITNAKVVQGDAHTWVPPSEEGTFDVVCFFDCFHDMSDPEGIAAEAYRGLKPGGIIFLIEPYSSYEDTTAAKLAVPSTPANGGFSVCFCTPCSKTVAGKEGLGTIAGTERHKAILEGVGFANFDQPCDGMEGQLQPAKNGFRLMTAKK